MIYQPKTSIVSQYPFDKQWNNYEISANNTTITTNTTSISNNNNNSAQDDHFDESNHHHQHIRENQEISKHYKNRSPRIPFTRDQLYGLETKFQKSKYLSGWEVKQLAKNLNLTETRVSFFIYFFCCCKYLITLTNNKDKCFDFSACYKL
ncbi:unnamed protein product [Trichobilharzia regenti]|nr:unnamed protein product [Trichobilharzia regenti]